ncbi:MAG: fibronectin type III domain-containing protein [Gammaproteobacteria bacterium]|nr:fibronectin type III domain-containing protein [Gammaproteobacteria bacterium]MBQ0774003.1 fibronectin type III domain-containing protein [Gammaproteobacteria bacterium]
MKNIISENLSKEKRKSASLFLMLLFSLALSACGAQSKDDDDTDQTDSPTPPPVEGDLTAPSTISNLSASSTSTSSIRISWTAPGDDGMTGTASQYDIRYSAAEINISNWNSASIASTSITPSLAGQTQNLQITGLNEDARYYFAIKTMDEVPNDSGISNIASAKTDAEPEPPIPPTEDTTAPAQVSDLSALVKSTATIQLKWTAPGDDSNNGTASEYTIRYANTPITNGNWDGATNVIGVSIPGASGDAQAFIVKGLSANTTYYFAIKSTDEADNTSTLSNVVSATTDANASGAATVSGALSSPYPTLKHLSINWLISGDNDEDGVVSVRYRPTGTASWKEGMNLFRVPAGSNEGFSWPNKHSGSLFSLTPNTEYEIELTLNDPDNSAPIVETITAHTRAVPQAAADSNTVNVTPSNFSSALSAANAGDILLLSSGSYSGFTVGRNGTPQQPIVIRGSNKNNVIINGDIRMDNRHDVYIESVTVNGMIKFNSSENIVVRNSAINTNGSGIVSQGNGTINAYIADNIVLGATSWANNTVGNNGNNSGEGIELTGPGNVIAYNYVKGFRDGISLLEDDEVVNQISFDIYNNDIEIGADDGIEADFSQGNVRVLNNRITNCYVALSSQPSLGGPTYFIGNVLYNSVYTPFKLHRGSVGDVALHNTSVKSGDAFGVFTDDTWSHAFFRNNIFIGGESSGSVGPYGIGAGAVANLRAAANNSSLDYDGYGSIGTDSFSGRIGSNNFSSLNGMRTNTSETHAQQVDMSIFAAAITFPQTVFPLRGIPDMRLKAGNSAIDSGVAIPNINDGFSGSAPDLGAYELGVPLPVYGPRS